MSVVAPVPPLAIRFADLPVSFVRAPARRGGGSVDKYLVTIPDNPAWTLEVTCDPRRRGREWSGRVLVRFPASAQFVCIADVAPAHTQRALFLTFEKLLARGLSFERFAEGDYGLDDRVP